MRRWFQILLVVVAAGVLMQLTIFLTKIKPTVSDVQRFQVIQDPAIARRVDGNLSERLSLPYKTLLNQPDICGNGRELIIVCITAPKNFVERQTVRETWGSFAHTPAHNTSLIFLLGQTNSTSIQQRLLDENRHYKDIVQEDFVDSYRNLTVKSVAVLKWVTLYCNKSEFVLKADDDMYINVPNTIKALREQKKKRDTFILGHLFDGAPVIRDRKSKWYTPLKIYSQTVYPRYTSGTAYSMTTSAAIKLFNASAEVPFFWLEDIYITGLVAQKADVPRVHNAKFNYEYRGLDGCFFRSAISGHRYSPENIRTVHRQVVNASLVCSAGSTSGGKSKRTHKH